MEDNTIKVFIIDDNVAARSMLARIIKEAPGIEVVGEAGTGQGGIIMLGDMFPDIVLLEASVSGGMKLPDILAEISNVSPDTKTILCTDYSHNSNMAEITMNGKYDFISKPYLKHIVIPAIRNAYRARPSA